MILLAAAAAVTPLPRTNGALTWQRRGARWEQAWFICDAIDRPLVSLVGAPNRASQVAIDTYRKPGLAATHARYVIGRDEPGMSQINTPLYASPGRTRMAGSFTSFAPAALPDPASATTGTFTSLRLGLQAARCRWLPAIRVALITPRRSVVVTREGGGYVYRSFDFAAKLPVEPSGWSTAPSLMLRGGKLVKRGRTDLYAFTNGTTGYRVAVSGDAGAPAARLTVTRRGRVLMVETAAAYTVAR